MISARDLAYCSLVQDKNGNHFRVLTIVPAADASRNHEKLPTHILINGLAEWQIDGIPLTTELLLKIEGVTKVKDGSPFACDVFLFAGMTFLLINAEYAEGPRKELWWTAARPMRYFHEFQYLARCLFGIHLKFKNDDSTME
jgi:hypothetical protein